MTALVRTQYANRWPDGEVSDIRDHPEIAANMADRHSKDGFSTTPVKRLVTVNYGDWKDA